ncbi:hypothetical protein EGW08_008876 [Elysia chlorotica]|uniref:Protein kinase domain-containing protein n=1 Tax=Elysia chlorotica TaxID=188477 RepID=A0A3S0ZUS2_ELYCH|nr:hypothetical protein EGW08_008876 [Elysia chlorotica]
MSSTRNEEQAVLDATRTCTNNQSMIDLTSKHLEELRTQCDKITQQEIKEAETKLIHLVGNQLVAKQKLNCDPIPEVLKEYPKLELWLRIVGIPENAIKEILEKGMSFSDLLHMEKDELTDLLHGLDCSDLEIKTLLTAFNNLRACTEKLLQGQPASGHDWHFTDLACLQAAAVAATAAARSIASSPAVGSSPKHQQLNQQQQRAGSNSSTSNIPVPNAGRIPDPMSQSEHGVTSVGEWNVGRGKPPIAPQLQQFSSGTASSSDVIQHHQQYPHQHYHPPRSQPSSPLPSPRAYNGSPSSHRSKSVSSPAVKYPITPPPSKNYSLFPDSSSITKSKSHESQLANKVVDIDPVKTNKKNKPQNINIKLSSSHEALYRRRLSTEGSEAGSRGPSGHSSPVITSPMRSPPYKHDSSDMLIADEHSKYPSNTLTVPRSPKTPMKIHHQTSHKLTPSMFVLAPCDLCLTFAIRGRACKVCKKKFHKDCAQRAPLTCGLSDTSSNALRDWQDSPSSQSRVARANILSPNTVEDLQGLKPVKSMPNFPGGALPDSGSNTSSCNSSSPSSPAYQQTSSDTITSPSPAPSPFTHTQFNFPGNTQFNFPGNTQFNFPGNTQDVVSTNTSNGSDKTLIDSNASEKTLLDRVDSVDSQDDPFIWNRQNSLAATMKEWDIPFDDLHVKEAIGKGRIGTVYRGQWHGDVAIKVLDTGSSADNDAQLAAFKLEIAVLRKTRHENLVLFMGACMTPPRLAIVTSFCKGQTLYTMIHLNRNAFKINKAIIVASQIAQGMSYLHARRIIHKDLRTKNIFVDSGKVIITDFGLFHITKLCTGVHSASFFSHSNIRKENRLRVPKGWLCYLAPEIIRSLKAMQQSQPDLPFTNMSDLYAFGTVWYELLCNDWPFRGQPCETVIWQVGRGIKQSLSLVTAPREVKEILMSCWSFRPNDRPDFSQIAKALNRIPRTRLIRSPSHPCQLSRSSEAISFS